MNRLRVIKIIFHIDHCLVHVRVVCDGTAIEQSFFKERLMLNVYNRMEDPPDIKILRHPDCHENHHDPIIMEDVFGTCGKTFKLYCVTQPHPRGMRFSICFAGRYETPAAAILSWNRICKNK